MSRQNMFILFNEICIDDEMLPKYIYFKLYDPASHQYNSTSEYRRDHVKRQITLSKKNIHTLNLETQKIHKRIRNSIIPEQLNELNQRFSVILNKNDYQHKFTLKKSLIIPTKATYYFQTILTNTSTFRAVN